MAIGRISGPLLKANLLREGVNLAFENDLLYLDVNNSRIGINNSSPQYDLDVSGTTRAPALEISTLANIGSVNITGTTISTSQPTLNLGAADNVIYQNKLTIDRLDLENNVISSNESNANIEFNPNGTGTVQIFADTNVSGNIVATGNITADGNITIGDANTDNITFNAEVASDILPDAIDTYSLGSAEKRWNDIRVNTLYADTVTTTNLDIGGIDLALRQGNIYYVAENGSDALTGTHPNDPHGSLKHALTQATSGDTIHIYPGVYQEIFPMTVPEGVTVKGHSMRSVNITPTVATNSNDAFLLNGGATIEDLTISGFYTGYAFKFAPGFVVAGNNRSPYIRNISVITMGSVTSAADPRGFAQGDAGKGAYIDGSVAGLTSLEATMLFHSATFITPGVDAITVTNGARVEWLNSFTYFANRGIYGVDGATGLRGTGKTAVRVTGLTGTIVDTNTFSYYDTDGTTVLATGTINGVDADGKFFVDGNLTGLTTAGERGGKTVTRYNNPVTDTAIKKFGSSSLQLDGNEDYIGLTSNNDFGFGTGDYTVEGWFYFNSVAAQSILFDFRAGAGTDVAPVVLVTAGGSVQFYSYNAFRITGPTLLVNTWYHIAVSRSAGTTKLYVNGASQGTPWVDSTDYDVAKPLIIGARWDGAAYSIDGYIDEVRVTKGLARYSANFVAPASEFTSDTDTKLLLHFNNADDSSIVIEDDTLNSQDIRFSNGATANFVTLADSTDFGAEVRSISSACVYGNFGVVGDGAGVLMYLISQNLAYIGVGKDTDNDNTNVIQANEVVELNRAKIRYSSVDHTGDFRVGDLFYVNQTDGTVNFTSSTFNIDTDSGITITTGGSVTTITGDTIDTGNLRISGNTIESISDEINFDSANSIINLKDNVNITGNLDVTGNVTIGGNITIGDEDTDSIEIIAGINSNLVPDATSTYSLGSNTNAWATLYTDEVTVDDITINTNVITTTVSNADLELRANGTGEILMPDNNVTFSQALTVSGDTDLQDTNVTGTITHIGDTTQTGDTTVTGNVTVTQDLDVSGAAQFEEILVDDNFITTTTSNADLELRANGTGRIIIPGNNAVFSQDLAVTQTISARNLSITSTVSSDNYTIGDIYINDNYIETTASNADLELRANGTGKINIPSNDVQIDNNLTVNGNVTVGNDLTITGDFTADDITLTGTATANEFNTGDIRIFQNVITTSNSNSDLELRANGTGNIIVQDFTFDTNIVSTPADMILSPGSELVIIDSTGSIKLPVGTTAQRPTVATGQIRYNSDLTRFEGYNGVNWINLKGVEDLDGNTKVTAELTEGADDNIIRFDIDGSTIVDINDTRLNAPRIAIDDIQIDGNVISTTTNTNLTLNSNGTGSVVFDNFAFKGNVITNTVSNSVTTFDTTTNGYVKFDGTYGLVIPSGGNAQRPALLYTETGQMRFNTDSSRVEIYDGSNWVSVAGSSAGISRADAEDLALEIVLSLG